MRRWGTMRTFRSHKTGIICCFLLLTVSATAVAQGEKITARFDQSIEAGRLSEVERDLFNYVVAHPQDAIGFSLLAKLRLKQNRLNEAKALANKALTLNLNLLSAKLIVAATNMQAGENEQARVVLHSISETDITDNAVRLNLAQAYVALNDCPQALTLTRNLPGKYPQVLPLRVKCYWATGDQKNLASAVMSAQLLAKQNPSIAVKVAEVLSQSAMHQEAVVMLRLAVVAAPKNVKALLLLARSEIALKDITKAKAHLAQAEILEPTSAELFFVKALLENEQNDSKKAFELLEKALTGKPLDVEILGQFVITAMRANYPAQAVRAAETLLELQPANLDFLYLFGAASLQNNNLERAETALTEFLKARPADQRACVALGLTFAAQPDKLDEARRQMQQCLTINPNNFEAAYQLGLSYKTQGETAKAIVYLEDAVKLAPAYASALRDLGAAYMQLGAETKARTVLEKAVSLNPNDAETHFQLSRLYNFIGETALAKKHREIFQKLRNPKKEGM